MERLLKAGADKLGLELVIAKEETDHKGRCVFELKPHGVKCLDANMRPLADSAPTPRPIIQALSKQAMSASTLDVSPHGTKLEVKTKQSQRQQSRREAAIAEFYAAEIAKSIKEYVKVTIGDYKIDERMAKVGKVFRWVSIISAINEILLSNEKVRTAFVKIAELAAGAGLTIASGVAALACGFAYPVCFVLFATLSNYYLPEHVGEAVGEIYDLLV